MKNKKIGDILTDIPYLGRSFLINFIQFATWPRRLIHPQYDLMIPICS